MSRPNPFLGPRSGCSAFMNVLFGFIFLPLFFGAIGFGIGMLLNNISILMVVTGAGIVIGFMFAMRNAAIMPEHLRKAKAARKQYRQWYDSL